MCLLCLYFTVIERIKWEKVCKAPVTEDSQQVITDTFKLQNSSSPPPCFLFPLLSFPPLSVPLSPHLNSIPLDNHVKSEGLLNYKGELAELLQQSEQLS